MGLLTKKQLLVLQTPSQHLARSMSVQSVHEVYVDCLYSVPVTLVMRQLCDFHDATGLPWWAVVGCGSLILRGLLMFPAFVTSQKTIAKRTNVFLTMDRKYIPELRRQAHEMVRLHGWSEDKAKWQFHVSRSKLQNDLIIRENCAAVKIYAPWFLQLPFWITTSLAIRRMCIEWVSWDLETQDRRLEFSTEGLLWIQNLCAPDPTLILPMVAGLTFLLNVEVHRLAQPDIQRLPPNQWSKWVTRILRGWAVAVVPIASVVPSAVALYWAASGICGVAVNLALKSPKVRRAVRIPDTPGESATPYVNIASNVVATASELKRKILGRRRQQRRDGIS